MPRSRSSPYVSLITTLFLYLGSPASTTYPSRRRGPPRSTFSWPLIIVTNASRIYSHHYPHIIGSEVAMPPCLSCVGYPCAINDLRRRISAFPHVDSYASSLFDIAAPRFSVLPLYRIYPYIHVLHTNAPVHVRLLPFDSPHLSGLFTLRSVAAALFTHTYAQKHTENSRKPHTSHSPSVVFYPISHLVVSFTSRAPSSRSRLAGRTGRALPPASPPPPALLVSARRSHPALLLPALDPPPCSIASSPVGIRSLCHIDSLVSPTAHAALFPGCFVHVNRSETVML